jgi:hypothetical protein
MIYQTLHAARIQRPRPPFLDLSLLQLSQMRGMLNGVGQNIESHLGFESTVHAVRDALEEIAVAERRNIPLPLSLTERR